MPWKVADVESHKSGLSPKQKRQWVAVANSALTSCMADGGEEETCAISAIQQANGVVNVNEETVVLENYANTAVDYQIQTRTYQGRKQLIVPVVMMVEGVHSGSHGPLLHLAEDLGRFPNSWDGIPVMIGHPAINGINVSANSPDVLEQSVGRVFNTVFENNKLKAQVWLDELKLTAISPTALAYIQNGRQLEVSIGVFTDEEESDGVYTNAAGVEEEFVAIARNHRPDHLALLPGETGACGWADGCGIRVNSNSETIEKKGNEMEESFILAMKQQAQNDLIAITVNKQGYQEMMRKLQGKLDALDTNTVYHILEEVYKDALVFRQRQKDGNGDYKYFQQSYQVNADDSVELVGTPSEVRRAVSYVQVNGGAEIEPAEPEMKRTLFNSNKKGDSKMAENDKPCCLEKVVSLLGNPQLNLNEAEDREWLLGLGPERLERMTPKELEVVETPEAPAVQVNTADYVLKSSLKTTDDFLAIAPPEVQDQMRSGLALHKARRVELIAGILANSEKDAWTEAELAVQDTAMLEKLSKQFKATVNYAAMSAGSPAPQVNQGEKLLPPGVE